MADQTVTVRGNTTILPNGAQSVVIQPESWTTVPAKDGQQTTTTTTQTTQQRSGVSTWISTSQSTTTQHQTNTFSQATMRSRDIVLIGKGLKPWANINVFFGGKNVNSSMVPVLSVAYSTSPAFATSTFTSVPSNIVPVTNVFPATQTSVPVPVTAATIPATSTASTPARTTLAKVDLLSASAKDAASNCFTAPANMTLPGAVRRHVLEVKNTNNTTVALFSVELTRTGGSSIRVMPKEMLYDANVIGTRGTLVSVAKTYSTNVAGFTPGADHNLTGNFQFNVDIVRLNQLINNLLTTAVVAKPTGTNLIDRSNAVVNSSVSKLQTTTSTPDSNGKRAPTPVPATNIIHTAATIAETITKTNTNNHNMVSGTPVNIKRGNVNVGTAILLAQTTEAISGSNKNVAKLVYVTTTLQAGDIVSSLDNSVGFSVDSQYDTGVKTNSMGEFYGVFHIAAGQWATGVTNVVLTDGTVPAGPTETTKASATYTTKGTTIQNWDVYTTTYQTQVHTQAVSETVVTGTSTSTNVVTLPAVTPAPPRSSDPLAQSFYINEKNGCFLVAATLYFYYVEAQYPVFVEIREMVNGYPGENIVANGTVVLDAKSLPYSQVAKIPARFTFEKPVYLNGLTNYCIVLRTQSNQTQVWTSKVGDKQIDLAAVVAEQPTLGALFKSQNNATWVSDDWSDLTFSLEKAVFETGVEGEGTYVNMPVSWQQLPNNPFVLKNGLSTAIVMHPNHGHQANDYVSISGSTDTQFNGDFKIISATDSQYEIPLAAPAVVTNGITRAGGAFVEASENKTVNIVQFAGRSFVPTGAEMHFKYDISSDRTLEGTFTPCTFNTDVFQELFKAEVLSSINEKNLIKDQPSLWLKSFMNTTDANVSPVLDLETLSATTVNYRVNYPSFADGYEHFDTLILNGVTASFTEDSANEIYSFSVTGAESQFGNFKVGNMIKIVNLGVTYNAFIKHVDINTTSHVCTCYYLVPVGLTGSKTINVIQNDNVVHEIAPTGGSAAFKYASRVLDFDFDSSGFKIWFDYVKPWGCNISLYYRVSGESAHDVTKDTWVKYVPPVKDMLVDTHVSTECQWIVNVPKSFKKLQFKLVMSSVTQDVTPLVRNLRFIALA